jgi:hypothetical protein
VGAAPWRQPGIDLRSTHACGRERSVLSLGGLWRRKDRGNLGRTGGRDLICW